jgi:hypothetical protein
MTNPSFQSFSKELEKSASAALINLAMNSFGALSAINEGKEKAGMAYKAPAISQTPLQHWSNFGIGRGRIYRPTNQLLRTRIPL